MAIGYFLDTYAIIEIINGNKNYSSYIDYNCYTSILNLYELHFSILKRYGKDAANFYFNRYSILKIDITEEDIPSGSEFKLRHQKNKVSYADALGYAIAARRGLKFLTGDKEFNGLPNVEFVK